ncbi:MAG: amidohydrolase family protein, partial [Muricauda sp.]|nr:amidohydrolase family protein [Allomuricauda sp.]
MRQKYFILTSLFFCLNQLNSQTLLIPDRVFDGKEIHADWVVAVDSNRITYAGPLERLKKAGAYITIKLEGKTVMPGLIEGHSHLLLHPYNETDWNDQVLKESPVERAIRGVVHAEKTLLAGVTAMRDLGSEGAGYTDIYLKKSIDEGLVPGPRTLMAGPAIVATGAYGPKGFHDGVQVPLGAVPVTGKDRAMEEVRTQLGNGANLIKIYADYRWGKDEPS